MFLLLLARLFPSSTVAERVNHWGVRILVLTLGVLFVLPADAIAMEKSAPKDTHPTRSFDSYKSECEASLEESMKWGVANSSSFAEAFVRHSHRAMAQEERHK